ncbi:MAG: helix-turn-helix domain-containing protein [Cyanobacteriota bacterium]|nr:helix-turn-helix domain-containing protein [Cyanobacteriota bacterium]
MKVDYTARIELTSAELKTLLNRQKTVTNRQKLQTLYWLKSGYCTSITEVAQLLGIHRTTVHRWFKKYRDRGLEKLLETEPRTGRPQVIPPDVIAGIEEKLKKEPGRFKSYKEIGEWVEQNYHIRVKYQTLHHQVRYRLKAKLKSTRRSGAKATVSHDKT